MAGEKLEEIVAVGTEGGFAVACAANSDTSVPGFDTSG